MFWALLVGCSAHCSCDHGVPSSLFPSSHISPDSSPQRSEPQAGAPLLPGLPLSVTTLPWVSGAAPLLQVRSPPLLRCPSPHDCSRIPSYQSLLLPLPPPPAQMDPTDQQALAPLAPSHTGAFLLLPVPSNLDRVACFLCLALSLTTNTSAPCTLAGHTQEALISRWLSHVPSCLHQLAPLTTLSSLTPLPGFP